MWLQTTKKDIVGLMGMDSCGHDRTESPILLGSLVGMRHRVIPSRLCGVVTTSVCLRGTMENGSLSASVFLLAELVLKSQVPEIVILFFEML